VVTRLGRRLTDLEDRLVDRAVYDVALEHGLTAEETAETLAEMRHEALRRRAGLPPATVEAYIARTARKWGLSDEERRQMEVDVRIYVADSKARRTR
jgi:hypothetical protein